MPIRRRRPHARGSEEMKTEPLVFLGTCHLPVLVRGKGFPASDLPPRMRVGVGLSPSNIMMSAFGPIMETPFGTEGEVMLVPDPGTKVEVELGEHTERFYLGDIMTTDGQPWECCPRGFLRRAVAALSETDGLTVLAGFEQELVYTGVEYRASATYALDAHRRQGVFGEAYMAALRAAGLAPHSFLPEYGPRQYEVTIHPTPGVRAADQAVIQREMGRAVAHCLGARAIFSPILDPDGVGNGTHIHFSLRDAAGRPVSHDPERPYGLSRVAEQFVAGVRHHLPALAAITAPSAVSYYLLRPNRWAPTWTNVTVRDRGSGIRICPIYGHEDAARQFNIEYRVADAAASPYLALGAVIWAGVDGIRNERSLPPEPARSFWEMSEAEREAAGARRLPQSLEEALAALEASDAARDWFGETFFRAYLAFKRAELRQIEGLTEAETCARYAEIY